MMLANEWGVPYEARRKRSIRTLHETWACDVYVVGKEEEQFYPLGASEPFTFHPSMSLVRYKRMKRGGEDPLVALGSLREGDRATTPMPLPRPWPWALKTRCRKVKTNA